MADPDILSAIEHTTTRSLSAALATGVRHAEIHGLLGSSSAYLLAQLQENDPQESLLHLAHFTRAAALRAGYNRESENLE